MESKLFEIIKMAKDKYGSKHSLTIEAAQVIAPFLKLAENKKELDEILDEKYLINIDELKSLFSPDNYNFERQVIGDIGVEK